MTTDVELRDRVARLEARAEIFDCVQRYARGIDRRDRTLLRSVYHDDAVDDYIGFVGPAEDFIDWAFAYHSTQTRHQHYLLNHTSEVDGDEAHAETYYLFVGTDFEPANHMTVSGGRYIDRLERRDGRWAIVDRVCIAEWIVDSTNLISEEVVAMLTGVKGAARDRSDPSYTRPLKAARASTDTTAFRSPL